MKYSTALPIALIKTDGLFIPAGHLHDERSHLHTVNMSNQTFGGLPTRTSLTCEHSITWPSCIHIINSTATSTAATAALKIR